MRLSASPTQNAAFSLIEVLVSVLVLGIGLVGLTHGITAALKGSKESELQTNAALLAAARIETLRAEDYLSNGETEGTGNTGFSQYQWTQKIEPTDIDGLHEVTVTISLTNTESRLYQLKTLLFEPPLTTNTWSTTGSTGSGQSPGSRSTR